jgi:hypothetical protein
MSSKDTFQSSRVVLDVGELPTGAADYPYPTEMPPFPFFQLPHWAALEQTSQGMSQTGNAPSGFNQGLSPLLADRQAGHDPSAGKQARTDACLCQSNLVLFVTCTDRSAMEALSGLSERLAYASD